MTTKIVRQASYSNLIDSLKWHLGTVASYDVGISGTYLPNNKNISLINKYTVPVKSLDTPTHSRVFLYFLLFSTLYNNSGNYEITQMESCSNQKSIKQIFKVARQLCTLLAFNQLNQLHKVVNWNAFQLTGVPC
jgi:hypothetical protein